jgi:hypothetical protein
LDATVQAILSPPPRWERSCKSLVRSVLLAPLGRPLEHA